MTTQHERRDFLRLMGSAAVVAGGLGAAAACGKTPDNTAEKANAAVASNAPAKDLGGEGAGAASPQPTPSTLHLEGPLSSGTNVPVLAEGGRLQTGAKRHRLEIVWQVDTDQKLVALTFDDGPDPRVSPLLYDILDETETKATFFLVGERVLKNHELIRGRMDRHEVGNHTYRHESMFVKNKEQALDDLSKTHKAIASVTGKEPRLFRPPYSHLNGNTMLAAGTMGYDVVMWSGYIGDEAYVGREAALVSDAVKNAGPGVIILAHDAGEVRLIAIRRMAMIIQQLRAERYEFVTVSELRSAVGK
jgi:peptidoglycan/xylan/chitin deacetylase (PgdA/CDA1 family)